jgi:hypothetical protein
MVRTRYPNILKRLVVDLLKQIGKSDTVEPVANLAHDATC